MIQLSYVQIIIGASAVGLALVAFLARKINNIRVDHGKAEEIAAAIREGAMTFLREEYKIICLVVIPAVLAIWYAFGGIAASFFIFGSLLSLTSGMIGM